MEKQFYSQCHEDKWIFDNIKLPLAGVFVDIGANHPINNNNTYAFEKYLGWEGVAIDINFAFAPGWAKHRQASTFFAGALVKDEYPFNTIAVCPVEANNFELVRAAKGLTIPIEHLQKEVEVGVVQVKSLINRALSKGNIELLSIDVEGMEYVLLENIFTHCLPKIIIVEHSTLWLERDKKILPLCRKHGYKLQHSTGLNHILTV